MPSTVVLNSVLGSSASSSLGVFTLGDLVIHSDLLDLGGPVSSTVHNFEMSLTPNHMHVDGEMPQIWHIPSLFPREVTKE